MSRAWEFFGEANGCVDEAEMRRRIARYRRAKLPVDADPEIGCIMLRDVYFFAPEKAHPAPPDRAPNIVQGRTYDLSETENSYIESVLRRFLAASASGVADHVIVMSAELVKISV